ncbi:RNA polymerase sigma factor [Thermomonospora umbrina]|uniref:DNA-directed RNA polymerase specialized sigma24 family protein n=1 Tax=Thermomonospora umbrina TaxID=111806 RepID=A0A3D9SQM3_9ACTN|nr:sigma-70 family RNA polymerase sigma factor [Thermomonospora umbrina]REE97927.1 DNA-directed RNA polymerase specialized sigma24 family protein [Thermomonospora umbrina]
MDDHALVEALRSGDPGASAALHDAHAERLYRYCWFLLRDDGPAVGALRQTLVTAVTDVNALRDGEGLTPWLYALARRECVRHRPAEPSPPSRPAESPEPKESAEATVGDDVDRRRLLARRAVAGMPASSRETLELWVRHGLPVPDLAAVLGLSVTEAEQALENARTDLEESLTAEFLAKDGAYGCPGRAEILGDFRGELTDDLRQSLLRHARDCPSCGTSGARSISPGKVYGLLPDVTPPPSLRAELLALLADVKPVENPAAMTLPVRPLPVQARSEGPPDPEPEAPPMRPRPRRRPSGKAVVLGTATGAGLVLAATSVGWVLDGADFGGSDSPASSGGRGKSRAPVARQVSPTWPLGSKGTSASPTARPNPPTTRRAEHAGPGRLTASPRFLDLGGDSIGTIELAALGGPVIWRSSTAGRILLSRTAGRLQEGSPAVLTLRVVRRAQSYGQSAVTFQPGGLTIMVTWRPGMVTGTRPTRPAPTAPVKVRPGRPTDRPTMGRPGSGRPTGRTPRPTPPQDRPSSPRDEPPWSTKPPEPPPSPRPSPAPTWENDESGV